MACPCGPCDFLRSTAVPCSSMWLPTFPYSPQQNPENPRDRHAPTATRGPKQSPAAPFARTQFSEAPRGPIKPQEAPQGPPCKMGVVEKILCIFFFILYVTAKCCFLEIKLEGF